MGRQRTGRAYPPCSGSAGEQELLTEPGATGAFLHPSPPAGPGATPAGSCPLASWALAQGECWREMAVGREGGQPARSGIILLARGLLGLSLCQPVAAPKSPASILLCLHPLFLAPPPASAVTHPLCPASDYLIRVCHLFAFWSPTTSSGHSED